MSKKIFIRTVLITYNLRKVLGISLTHFLGRNRFFKTTLIETNNFFSASFKKVSHLKQNYGNCLKTSKTDYFNKNAKRKAFSAEISFSDLLLVMRTSKDSISLLKLWNLRTFNFLQSEEDFLFCFCQGTLQSSLSY